MSSLACIPQDQLFGVTLPQFGGEGETPTLTVVGSRTLAARCVFEADRERMGRREAAEPVDENLDGVTEVA